MPLYRKKAEVVEALQYTGGLDNSNQIIAWIFAMGGSAIWVPSKAASENSDGSWNQETPEHIELATDFDNCFIASVGDWIIRVDDKFYPSPRDVFVSKYEQVN